MNLYQQGVVIAAVCGFIGMGIYSPWVRVTTQVTSSISHVNFTDNPLAASTFRGPSATSVSEGSGPYQWIFDPPPDHSYNNITISYRLDHVRLLIQWALLGVATATAFYYFKLNPPLPDQQPSAATVEQSASSTP